MAPTEMLARQHYHTLTSLLTERGSSLQVGLLVGGQRVAERRKLREQIESGEIQLVVGTQALICSEAAFANLGLVVIDEQHRFGVHQRLNLSAKGLSPEILAMTATPIPRTLCLTSYGDMDLSMLLDKPSGRQLIDTRTISLDRLDDVIKAVGRAIFNWKKIYWVCPLIDE